ncbi:MAG: hypothetical protein F6K28_42475 [Microcoleus sp. SIO2G3]|nr:hypothetical protein [Microcoleus sp. SIO2G3]
MDTNEIIIQELEETPESMLEQVLSFLLLPHSTVKIALEGQQDLEDARAALAEAETEGKILLEAFKQELGL